MKLTTEGKLELVSRYYNGESATDICLQSGVSKSTFYTWLKPHKNFTTDVTGNMVSAATFARMKQQIEKLQQKV